MLSLQKIISNILVIFSMRIELNFIESACIDINDILLKNTNEKRKLHNIPELTLNRALIPDSETYARELASRCALYHSQGDYGENLFLTMNPSIDFYRSTNDFGCIDAFYSEISCYCGYESECPPCVYGHFTQLVWASSTSQGCGTCKDESSGCIVIVCRYTPAGNMRGAFVENVKPPYGTQPPIWEIFQTASNLDFAIAGAILAAFFGIVAFSFVLHQGYLPYFF